MIPQQIDTDFVRAFESSLDIALYSMDITQEKSIRWLTESPKVVQKRGELVTKQKRLESARDKLDKHHTV